MEHNEPNPQERLARQTLTQDPLYIGVDGQDAAHYWDSYDWAVAVVEADAQTVETHELARSQTLAEWCDHVEDRRGWAVGPHVGGSLLGDLVEAMK